MAKIAHEAPIEIFDEVQARTDYDYALVHLFEENDRYYEQFKAALKKGREVILDNSIFELGTAFDSAKFAKWINLLEPTYYIIPDVLEDSLGTVDNFIAWENEYKGSLPGKRIAVAQGKSYDDFCECYRFLVNKVDKIAISFDYSFLNEWVQRTGAKLPTKYHEWMLGRQLLIIAMMRDGVLNEDKPHHLLGCGLPQEFKGYRNYKFIDSIDTSNPVVAGLKGIRYSEDEGLEDKPSEKLFTLINMNVSIEQLNDVTYNIKWFRKIVNG